MPKKDYLTKDGKQARPIKDKDVQGMDLPDNVAPPISDSTLKAIRTLVPKAPAKLPRKGWGGK